ncbi:hypothetical protein U0035_02935 [Niabella yanshanensis]|uniref:ATP-dependent DNA helicase RecG n=1 Tax=Niabella yanshanensis TaxID=577386 RepID=A0ABZ0W9D5_9BACT|nr:ATP-binding protein [Niabella yanshanensis]WQD39102.1 hypothetical protein U0035_02935 [Niabella yanshanensis]
MKQNIRHIIERGEAETSEFKSFFGVDVTIALGTFCNAKGGAVYISDSGEMNGLGLGKETIAQWSNEIKNKMAPVIISDVEIKNEDKTIALLTIQEYSVKPVSVREKYYKRVKNVNHQLAVSGVVNMHLQPLNTSRDAYPDHLHNLDDISLDKVQHRIKFMKVRGMTITEVPLPFLLKYNLIREEKPVNAAYLMFKSRDSIASNIELGGFQNIFTNKDAPRTQADIITQVEKVLDFVKKHINIALVITGNAQNIQKWQYPLEAVREIVLNMIIHRDYRVDSHSVLKMFDDKIEFYNPRKLSDCILVEDLSKNHYKSTPRNKAIAEFLKFRLDEKIRFRDWAYYELF